jgi:hypothetical protein
MTRRWTGPRFYDIWVARDEAGQRFTEDPPIVRHAHGKDRTHKGTAHRQTRKRGDRRGV